MSTGLGEASIGASILICVGCGIEGDECNVCYCAFVEGEVSMLVCVCVCVIECVNLVVVLFCYSPTLGISTCAPLG